MIVIQFEIYLQEPLLATAVEGDPNSAVSLPYIPGSLIHGALVNRYLQAYPTDDLAADPQARQLFFSGETRFLNAYPSDETGNRTLPTPASWYKEKNAGKAFTAYDLSIIEEPAEELEHPIRVEKPFCALDDREATLYEPRKQIAVHTQRDRAMGRATEGSGAVFQYEALAPEQTFIGVVLCPDDETAQTVETLLAEQEMFLGGSRSAGYGLTEIRAVRRASDDWTEAPNQDVGDIQQGKAFSLTLLSDAVLRDGNGQYTGFLTPEILQAHLGVPVTLVDKCTLTRQGIAGGFNRKWGLPLPQVSVARAGSVYTFCAKDDITADRLQALLESGIGERRAEGFGRIALHWNRAEEISIKEPAKSRTPHVRSSLTGESANLAHRMATRMLRRRVDTALIEQVNRLRLKGEIKNNQLSAIRTLARGARLSGDAQPIIERLKGMKDTARKQFENTRVAGQPLHEWIQELLLGDKALTDTVWEAIHNTSFDVSRLPAVGGIRAEWDETMAREYALRLIDGVLSRALEERRGGK